MSALVGVAIGVVGKAVSSLGLVLQKKAHHQNLGGKHFCMDLRWLLAFLTYFTGNLIVIVSLVLAPQMVIAALDCLVMVFNALLAPQLLEDETLSYHDIAASAVIVAGVAVVIVFGPRTAQDYSDVQLLSMLWHPAFEAFTIACLSLCIFLYFGLRRLEAVKGKAYVTNDSTTIGSLCALGAGTVPAVLSSFNLQLSKITGELVSTSLKGNNQFDNWPVYMFIALLVVCNTTQVVVLQRALQDYDALLIIPVFQVQLTIFGIVNGGVYFNEFAEWRRPLEPVLFCGGVAICLVGVVVLAARKWDRAAKGEGDHALARLHSRSTGDECDTTMSSLRKTMSTETHQDLKSTLKKSLSFGTLLDPSVSGGSAILAAENAAIMSDDESTERGPVVCIYRPTPPSNPLDKDLSDVH